MWLGDADRGYGADQPGSWCYSILPFIEQKTVYDLPADGQWNVITTQQRAAAAEMAKKALPLFNCPSRRSPAAYPHPRGGEFVAGLMAYNADDTQVAGRCDYAANAGDKFIFWGPGPDPEAGFAGGGFVEMKEATGVVYQRSQTTMGNITDGTSNTYLVGERHFMPMYYGNGSHMSLDDHSLFAGDDYDIHVWTVLPPLKDANDNEHTRFGSAHPAVFQVVMCDGSVHAVSYNIDRNTHRYLGNRIDGQVASVK